METTRKRAPSKVRDRGRGRRVREEPAPDTAVSGSPELERAIMARVARHLRGVRDNPGERDVLDNMSSDGTAFLREAAGLLMASRIPQVMQMMARLDALGSELLQPGSTERLDVDTKINLWYKGSSIVQKSLSMLHEMVQSAATERKDAAPPLATNELRISPDSGVKVLELLDAVSKHITNMGMEDTVEVADMTLRTKEPSK